MKIKEPESTRDTVAIVRRLVGLSSHWKALNAEEWNFVFDIQKYFDKYGTGAYLSYNKVVRLKGLLIKVMASEKDKRKFNR